MQVGDPFTEKVLIECCLELIGAGLVVGIQDLGGAGLSCATSELASAGDGGMRIDLDAVPLRATGMTPAEILSSESQERMCAVVRPADVERFLAICTRWDVLATVIGEVTDGDRLEITWGGETVVDVPPRTVAHDGPVYRRPVARSARQDALVADVPDTLPRPAAPSELRAEILRMVASPNLASRAWVTDQYDRYVRGNTVCAQPADAGMIRIDERTGRGVAVATDCNARFVALDPYAGTQLALAEAYRNVATTGAVPIAVTNCLNFGSPEDPHVMWQFREAVRGLADGCAQLGIPVTGGNVSFYNQTGDRPILPTPVVGVLGVIEDVARRVRPGFSRDGDVIVLLGATREEFGGSEWAHVAHGHLGGRPPAVDLAAEQRLARLLAAAAADGLLTSAHDLSDGGLAQALVESCLIGGAGAMIDGLPRVDRFVALFSESAARVLVTVRGLGAAPGACRRRRGARRADRLDGRQRARHRPCAALAADRAAGGVGGHAPRTVRLSPAPPPPRPPRSAARCRPASRAALPRPRLAPAHAATRVGATSHPAGEGARCGAGGAKSTGMRGRIAVHPGCAVDEGRGASVGAMAGGTERPGGRRRRLAAVLAWLDGGPAPERAVLRAAVKESLAALAAAAPGRSVEVRVPPFGAVQCISGLRHGRGTPPNVVEADPRTWLALVTGRLGWDEAQRTGRLSASGTRTGEVRQLLPLM